MSQDLFHRRSRTAAIARTTSRRDMSYNIIDENTHDSSKLEAVLEGAYVAGKNVLPEETNRGLKEEEIAKPLDFLHFCGVCRRSLGSERDIYIYRGESAFCSNECREKQIKFDATKSCNPNSSWHQ